MGNVLWSGLGYGILCIIFFGLYATPRRYAHSPSLEFLLTMCITVAICSSITGVFLPGWFAISLPQMTLSYLSGLLWCMGMVCYIYSVDCVGVGFGFALGAALFYALYGIPGKLVMESMDSVWPYFMLMGQGALAGALACYFIIGKDRSWARVSRWDIHPGVGINPDSLEISYLLALGKIG